MIPAFAAEAYASAAKAGGGLRLGFNVDLQGQTGFSAQHSLAADSNSIQKGGH